MFKKIRKKKKFEEVLDQFRYLLMSNTLVKGQRLPNEIDLSKSMGISRSSLRESLKILSLLGIIDGRPGEGTVIKEAEPENLKSIISLVLVSKEMNTQELFEVRVILESSATGYAAKRRTEADLKRLHSILTNLDQSYKDGNEKMATTYDMLFHQAIVLASQNKVLIMLEEMISDLLEEQITMTRTVLSSAPAILDRFQNEHWGIYNAIEEMAHAEAEMLMKAHLENSQTEVNVEIEGG
ncbi:FadR/GntR family transcriptional regulator [Planococcus sp. FY231025]|uniref:FadR/GntR family transcriptional regulator n=1 Tax=Planococcus sp. FY231025 TaxID=3455699 RepID=UPI003F8F4B28